MTAVCLATLLVAGCRTGTNYVGPEGPAYAAPPPERSACTVPGRLKIVSFNVAFGREAQAAAEALSTHPDLICADIVLLQEMDEAGTRVVADRLGMGYTYYPAVFHFRSDRDFGNAVLYRFPVLEQSKLVLPHVSLLTRTQRIATAVTLDVGSTRLRVYSTHLGTPLEVGPGARRAQLRTILEDAGPYATVLVGGDLNSGSVGEVAQERGFAWPTREGPSTVGWGRWDHIFARGFDTAAPDAVRAGTVTDLEQVSDHAPVWVELRWQS